jgi:hypothetical protein
MQIDERDEQLQNARRSMHESAERDLNVTFERDLQPSKHGFRTMELHGAAARRLAVDSARHGASVMMK